jgi:hypothetical protein
VVVDAIGSNWLQQAGCLVAPSPHHTHSVLVTRSLPAGGRGCLSSPPAHPSVQPGLGPILSSALIHQISLPLPAASCSSPPPPLLLGCIFNLQPYQLELNGLSLPCRSARPSGSSSSSPEASYRPPPLVIVKLPKAFNYPSALSAASPMENAPASITIPDQRHRAIQAEAGSSPSSYSSSPSSPEPSPKTPSRAPQKQKLLHARRPSLLSECPSPRMIYTLN